MNKFEKKYNILAIDDSSYALEIFDLLGSVIEECNIFTAYDFDSAYEIVKNNYIHIIFIDIVLHDDRDGGYNIGKKFQEIENTSRTYYIFMSSEKNELIHRLKAYTSGAQDFIQKPFNIKELEMLIRSKIQYFEKNKLISQETKNNRNIGLFIFDSKTKSLTVNKKDVNLTSLEFKLMEFFISNPEKGLTIQDIMEGVWENTETTTDNARTFIYKLRAKIEEDPKSPVFIVNSKSNGYVFYPFGKKL